ncbi:TRAFAC clade GTPase domain-containing protein [Avibacterium avium]|uniref:TRAFAC clade GTPase domain-containing protein n=1 Tax=Avibacterium avium TaxID=751 RepID=UPI003BF7AF67
MLNNPFLKKEESLEQQKEFLTHSIEQKELEFSDDFPFDSEDSDKTLPFDNNDTYHSEPTFEAPAFDKYQPKMQFERELKRDLELNDEEYHQRLLELNTDAENKHYVLFFGQPASGKTWIIGSLLHYMKNYLGGTVYLDTHKSTESEEELFYQLQDRFNGVTFADKITSTDTKQYFEFHISFTPRDSSKPPINFVFIDASGEHSEQGFRKPGQQESGKLPNYLTAILESDVKTKLAFVYDQSLKDVRGAIPQVNVLDAVFTHIQQIQNHHNKFFPKALLLSKADRIELMDHSTVVSNGFDPMLYAIEKIPSFANSFFNESEENKTIFYKMGKFSTNSDLLLEFDKECPEKLFRWLYMSGTGGISPVKELTCWEKFVRWFKGK